MRNVVLFGTLALVAFSFGCGGPTPNTNVPVNTANVNAPGSNLVPATPTPEAVTNAAPTLTPVIKLYCEAMNKKDEAALRKIYSSDTLKNFEMQMKQQKVKTLMQFLEDDKVGNTCELSNEQISGDTATATFKSDTYKGNGLKIVFVKEGGEWKLTNKSPALDSMQKSTASNSNAGK